MKSRHYFDAAEVLELPAHACDAFAHFQKISQSSESDVVVGVTGKDLIEQLVVLRHSLTIAPAGPWS